MQAKNSISLNILNREDLFKDDKKSDFEKSTISDEFQSLISSSAVDRRVAEQMMRLFRQGGC